MNNLIDIKPAEFKCSNCGFKGMKAFYEAGNVPVHSCILQDSREEALSFPTGDILLGLCENCGFIANLAYEPKFRDYSTAYEDQQSFSGTFNVFAKRLAQSLIDKYELHEKQLIEIGCGKGDFLMLICELGNNSGIGIDPAYIEARVDSPAAAKVKFIRDYYTEKYKYLHGDMILCRHTLEHIDQTAQFVRIVRDAIGVNSDTIVFFEIPETKRVLKELAFWDIYYEHCSYFTPGSLGRLFRHESFEIIDLYTDFDDQYLLIECRPAEQPTDSPHPSEEPIKETALEVDRFKSECARKLHEWKSFFEGALRDNKRVAIWGSGSKCVAFMTTLGLDSEIGMVVDINPHRHGKFIPGVGKEIVSPRRLIEFQPDLVVVMNPVYKDEIAVNLREMSIGAELIAV
jgi:SAM-dependent methyltransferase